ncbi:MAG: hypothetical protein COB98_02470 [Flavobacteriaceae bacterium]|nr:MAG: hypothetical protein COB98_02470 [Flavobacteriaceae bacterium]
MSNDHTKNKFKKLLDKLQQDSWQLELLISGFSILGLFTAIEFIKELIAAATIFQNRYKAMFLFIVLISCHILIFNLIIHVILRGLWIGALGLRYISGDIDFDNLNYQARFKSYLKRKIISFDKYIASLENYCSILFSISFLLVFYLISVFLMVFILILISKFIISNENLPKVFREIGGNFLAILVLIGAFLTLIDFITQGYLKKKKILSKIYFPFYWAYSYLTLSFLYRPLVYNFLDNKFGKRVSLFLVPIYIFIFFLISGETKVSNYIDYSEPAMLITMKNENYWNMYTEKYHYVKTTTIQSKIIKENYINIFSVFNSNTEDNIFKLYTDIKPEKDLRGYKFNSPIRFKRDSKDNSNTKDSLQLKYLEMYNIVHQLYIDSTAYKTEFLVSKNSKGQLGFETFINIKNLSEGKHVLKIERLELEEKDTLKIIDVVIPFWHFKQ